MTVTVNIARTELNERARRDAHIAELDLLQNDRVRNPVGRTWTDPRCQDAFIAWLHAQHRLHAIGEAATALDDDRRQRMLQDLTLPRRR